MKKSIYSSLLALALSLGGQAGYAIPTELITNGGFEYGGKGWSLSNVAVLGTHNTVSAYSGNYMAVGGFGGSYLRQSVDTRGHDDVTLEFKYSRAPGNKKPVPPPIVFITGPDSEELLPDNTLPPTIEPDPTDCEVVKSQSGTDPDPDTTDGSCTTDSPTAGWNTYTAFVSLLGFDTVTLDIFFDVGQPGGDPSQLFTPPFIDDVSIIGTVPVPGTLALFGIGLLGLAEIRRRQVTLAS